MQPGNTQELWYRNHWVWLLIAIPALTVAGCLLTIFLAVTHPDQVVDDAEQIQSPAAQPSSR